METQINEISYAEGFNKAYLLYQYEPDVAKSFIDNEVAIYDDFSAGFSEGLAQAQQEKTLSEFEQLRSNTDEQNLSVDR